MNRQELIQDIQQIAKQCDYLTTGNVSHAKSYLKNRILGIIYGIEELEKVDEKRLDELAKDYILNNDDGSPKICIDNYRSNIESYVFRDAYRILKKEMYGEHKQAYELKTENNE